MFQSQTEQEGMRIARTRRVDEQLTTGTRWTTRATRTRQQQHVTDWTSFSAAQDSSFAIYSSAFGAGYNVRFQTAHASLDRLHADMPPPSVRPSSAHWASAELALLHSLHSCLVNLPPALVSVLENANAVCFCPIYPRAR